VRLLPGLYARWTAQQGYLFPWLPVCLGAGAGIYFALPEEPGPEPYFGLISIVVVLALIASRGPELARPFFIGAMVLICGVVLAGLRAQWLAEPVLGFRYYGTVEGRVVLIDRSRSDRVRLTLDRVRLDRVAPAKTPAQVRVSLSSDPDIIAASVSPEPGMRVAMTAFLSPAEGPVEPGGFDFQRLAWFRGLGAVGYTRAPLLRLEPVAEGAALWIQRLRRRISLAVRATVPGEAGGFAAAILTGDRSGISQATQEDLRRANLSHLLAISGLHLGLLTGVVFGVVRAVLALIPWLALRLPLRKVAAVCALMGAAMYLALSGGNVATVRAFVMVAVMLVAVLCERRAISLRAVAIAALIVIALRPEAVTGPGFQMSFAATTALVAVFSAARDWPRLSLPRRSVLLRISRPVLAVLLSSLVAGLATAPVAAAHFNRIADYGLIANLLSVPLMGAVVMPAAVLAAVLAPFGLASVGLAVMEPAIRWILAVADRVAALDGAVTLVPAPPGSVLPLLALGALCVILVQGRMRWSGVLLIAAGFVIWSGAGRPAVLISGDGALVGVMTPEGRALSKPRGQGFVARSWLENDGDAVDQAGAALRAGLLREKGAVWFDLGGTRVVQLSGRGAVERVVAACDGAALVILAADFSGPAPCKVLARDAFRRSGALALVAEGGGVRIRRASEVAGRRVWNSPGTRFTFWPFGG
jgi:competence protein ComEC